MEPSKYTQPENFDRDGFIKLFMEDMPCGYVIHDQDAEIVDYNDNALEILGLTEDQLLGKTPTDERWKTVKEDGTPFPIKENPALLCLKTKKPVRDTLMGIETGLGDFKWIRINAFPMKQNFTQNAVVIFRDITEDYNYKKMTNLVLESSGIGIWKYYFKDDILEWDDLLHELYEIDKKDFTGKYADWENTVHPDDKELSAKRVQYCIKTGELFSNTFRTITPTGKIKYISGRGDIIKDAHGDPYLMIGTNWDSTEEKVKHNVLKKAKKDAEEFAKRRETFLATMSHEIRTPLNGIIGMTTLMNSEEDLNEDQSEMMGMITSCGKNLMGIVDDILCISKLENGADVVQRKSFSLRDTITDTIYSLQFKADKCGVDMNVNVDKSVPNVMYSDERRLVQVIVNLMENAIKFSEENSDMLLDMSVFAGKMTIVVSDQGIGIAKEHHEEVFELYRQVDGSLTRKFEGTGLGLAITKKLVTLLGGTISLDSTLGKGTTFTVKIPFVEGQLDDGRMELETVENDDIKLLVVEDNRVNQKVVGKILEKNGYTFDLATNGQEAVDLCKDRDYSLVLMDLQMPVMDGITATEEILKMTPSQTVVAMTANILDSDREKCESVGMKGFLGKPFTSKDLLRTVIEYTK